MSSEPEAEKKGEAVRAKLRGTQTAVPVHRGDVLFTLGAEITQAARELERLRNFERRVAEAATSPAEWLLLREELNPRERAVDE